jgi:hypothetical protein
MGVPTSEVGYTSATTGRGDHEVHNGHEVALEKKTPGRLHGVVERGRCNDRTVHAFWSRPVTFSTQVYSFPTDEVPFLQCQGRICCPESSILLAHRKKRQLFCSLKKSVLIVHLNTTYVDLPIRINYEAD